MLDENRTMTIRIITLVLAVKASLGDRLVLTYSQTGVHSGYTASRKQKANLAGWAKCLILLVARGGIEPPTQGFSILCSTD
jgi:hypothetical protein